jgi:CHASE2 domain-containing sensor protein
VLTAVARGRPAVIVEATEYRKEGGPKNGGEQGTRQLQRALRHASRRLPSGPDTIRVLLVTNRVDVTGATTLFGLPRARKRFFGAEAGYGGRKLDVDGALRRVLYEVRQKAPPGSGDEPVPMRSLTAEATDPTGARLNADDFPAWNDVAGGPGTYPHISFVDVRDGRVDPARFRDRIVIIGSMSTTSETARPTARAGGAPMSPAEVEANEIATLRAGLALRDAPDALTVALIIALALLSAACAITFTTWRAVGAGIAVALLFLVAGHLAFLGGSVLALVTPLIALLVGIVANPLVARAARISQRAY